MPRLHQAGLYSVYALHLREVGIGNRTVGAELAAGLRSADLTNLRIVVANVLFLVPVMSKTVPLTRALRSRCPLASGGVLQRQVTGGACLGVQLDHIIVDISRGFVDDLMLEAETVVRGRIGHVQWQVQAYTETETYVFGRGKFGLLRE